MVTHTYVGSGGISLGSQPGAFDESFSDDFDIGVTPTRVVIPYAPDGGFSLGSPLVGGAFSNGFNTGFFAAQAENLAYPVIPHDPEGGLSLGGSAECSFTPFVVPEPPPPRQNQDPYRWDLGSGPFFAIPGYGFARRSSGIPLTLKITVGADTYYQTRTAKAGFAVWIKDIQIELAQEEPVVASVSGIRRGKKGLSVKLKEWGLAGGEKARLSVKEIKRWTT